MSGEHAEPDLVGLFYRADWTKLSLSARVSGMVDFEVLARQTTASPLGRHSRLRSPEQLGIRRFAGTLRLEPGGQYDVDIAEPAHIGAADVLYTTYLFQNGFCSRDSNFPLPPFLPPYPDLLRPARLLNGFTLELRGEIAGQAAAAAGRRAFAVVATPVPGTRTGPVMRPERIEVIADAGTGILLRSQESFEGRTVRVTELTGVTFGAPGDAFTPPEGDDWGLGGHRFPPFEGFSGPGWRAARTATNAAGTVLGTVVRHAPGRGGAQAGLVDPDAAMPPDDEESQPAGTHAGGSDGLAETGDEPLQAMYRSGRAEFSGTLHTWADAAAMAEGARSKASEHGWGGVGSAAEALGDRHGTVHQVWRVRIAGGGRYRVEHLLPEQANRPRILTCDGEQLWREFADKVVISPAAPLKGEIADLADTSRLLECWLTDIRETVAGGRRAFALRVSRAADSWGTGRMPAGADLVVDAELGIALRYIWRIGGKQVQRCEFRDVTAGHGDDGEFSGHVPPGVRVVHADGGLLDDVMASLPEPARVAAKVAGSGLKAARGFLDFLSDRRER